MERFNVPIPPDDDFPQVICAQRRGEDFQTECVEYVPRWKVDGFMVVDKSAFFALADMASGLDRMLGNAETENAKLRELCKDMMAFVEDDDACERCGHDAECVEAADGELVLPYEGRCLMLDLFADRMRDLGIEVDG